MPGRTMARKDAGPSGMDPKRASRDRSRLKARLIGEGAQEGKSFWDPLEELADRKLALDAVLFHDRLPCLCK